MNTWVRWGLAAFLVVSLELSAGPASYAADAQWVEIQSPHFSVVTDAGERRGREVAMRFEQMRAVFGALMTKANVNIPVPLQIVAFRNSKELRQIAPLWNGKPDEIEEEAVSGFIGGGAGHLAADLSMFPRNRRCWPAPSCRGPTKAREIRCSSCGQK